MRMEELSDNRYIKGTDTVERYLLNLVQEYFKSTNVAASTSREYIIKKAVERMKEEITFDSIGVLSITLPDGVKRTGAVNISLEDLNGEPLISPKLSAFNVSFGNEQNTACEGNDPRLTDARKPLAHEHNISDVVGLEGILSTLTGKVERVEGFLHTHTNEDVLKLLVYTGEKDSIDLTVLETLEGKVLKLVDEIREGIINYTEEINTKINDIDEEIVNVKKEITELKQYIIDVNNEQYTLAKQYTDERLQVLKDDIDSKLGDFVTAQQLSDVLNVANGAFTYVGSMKFDLDTKINFTNGSNHQDTLMDIDPSILLELNNRKQTLKDCQIEILLEYQEITTNKIVYGTLPYIIFNETSVDGSIQLNTLYDTNQIMISIDSESMIVPQEIKDARVIYKVYSRQEVLLR